MATSKKGAGLVDVNVAGVLDDIFKVRPGIIEDANSFWADRNILDDNPFQPRGDIGDYEAIAMKHDLDENGQLQGALARVHPDDPTRYQLCDGHTRKDGVKRGGNAGSQMENPQQYSGKLFITVRPLSDLQMLKGAISANETRTDLNTLDLARAYVHLRRLAGEELKAQGVKLLGEPDSEGNPQASWRQAATYAGQPYRHMHRTARLLELDKEVQKGLANGDIGERHGRALLELAVEKKDAKDPAQIERYRKAQRQVLHAIYRHNLTGDGTMPLVKRMKDLLWQSDKTLLDDEIEKAFQQIAEEKRVEVLQENRQKLEQGTAHLGDVNAPSGAPRRNTPAASISARSTAVDSDKAADAPYPLDEAHKHLEAAISALRHWKKGMGDPHYRLGSVEEDKSVIDAEVKRIAREFKDK